MKKVFFSSIAFFSLLACDSNPLGKTSFSDCDHSPNSNTGLPVECQVSVPFTDKLFIWLDAHDSGTVILQNQTDVTSWLDKSGHGSHLLKSGAGSSASLKKKGTNDRNTILFPLTSTNYGVNHALLGFLDQTSFTLAISFKTQNLSGSTLTLANNNNFDFKITPGGNLTYSIGSLSDIPTGVVFAENSLYKIVFSYNDSTQSVDILNSGGSVHIKNLGFSNNAWPDFQLIAEGAIEINEILVYTSVVNPTSVQSYLNSKWGF